ncbi:hypothetical protein Hanom_Chr07g00601491 [Helianthus anomalus]
MSVSGFGSRQFVSGSDYSDDDGYFSSRLGLYFRFGSAGFRVNSDFGSEFGSDPVNTGRTGHIRFSV